MKTPKKTVRSKEQGVRRGMPEAGKRTEPAWPEVGKRPWDLPKAGLAGNG